MWFDEYNNSGKERGCLGQPVEEGHIILETGNSHVWRRKYEHGNVICNRRDVQVAVDIDDIYRTIKGNRMPEINNGKSMETFAAGSRGGRTLWKNAKC